MSVGTTTAVAPPAPPATLGITKPLQGRACMCPNNSAYPFSPRAPASTCPHLKHSRSLSWVP